MKKRRPSGWRVALLIVCSLAGGYVCATISDFDGSYDDDFDILCSRAPTASLTVKTKKRFVRLPDCHPPGPGILTVDALHDRWSAAAQLQCDGHHCETATFAGGRFRPQAHLIFCVTRSDTPTADPV